MRATTPEIGSILSGSFRHRWLVDVHYDDDRVLADIPATGVRLSEDVSGAIEASGSLSVVWADEVGRSMSPPRIEDVFAPFGGELALYCIVSAGRSSGRVTMGRFPIFDVPSSRDESQIFDGHLITTGSVIDLTFKDRFLGVQRDRFDTPGVPPSLTSVYGELARLTGLQITRTVSDAQITRSVVYEEDRLKAVYDLASVLDTTPFMTSDGTLSLRPKTPTELVGRLKRGEDGTILSVGNAMSAEQVYNRVAFRGKTDDATVILAAAERTSGPLRVRNADGSRSPFGRVTRFLSNEYVTTRVQAQEYVNRELERSARLGTVIFPMRVVFNPLFELGDVLEVERADKVRVGRIVKLDRGSSGDMSIDLEVADG